MVGDHTDQNVAEASDSIEVVSYRAWGRWRAGQNLSWLVRQCTVAGVHAASRSYLMITGRESLRTFYQRDDIAEAYIPSRYGRDPFDRAVHARQARLLRTVVARQQVRRLLEIAPGPARLTVYATATECAYGVDASAPMLRLAKARLAEFGVAGWRLVCGDAFHLPVEEHTFDFAMCFKLIRHFARDDRLALLAEIRRVLQPGGHLLLDVVNAPANRWLHDKWGVQEQQIDDYWFTEATFRAEMRDAGFRVATLYPVHPALPLQFYTWAYLWRLSPRAAQVVSRALEVVTRRHPLEWLALCTYA
jgi:ubiquinone/menaquinone biosynthesis C-methylase UbiE